MIRRALVGIFGPLKWTLIFMLIGVLLVLPRLFDAVWQDEAYTLLEFASHGFLYPFTDYHLPKNHVLLSALLSIWGVPGDSIVALRSPFLLAFIVSMGLLAWAAKRMAGNIAALLAVAFFAFSTITENFALQLRGYGIPWLFVTMMVLALPSVASQRRAFPS